MFKFIKKTIMAFINLFKDDNDYDEKNIVGFASFVIMSIFAFADVITGIMGKDLAINETIYNSFLFLTLGCFGISEIGKRTGNKKDNANDEV
jgi:hypothetical protein